MMLRATRLVTSYSRIDTCLCLNPIRDFAEYGRSGLSSAQQQVMTSAPREYALRADSTSYSVFPLREKMMTSAVGDRCFVMLFMMFGSSVSITS